MSKKVIVTGVSGQLGSYMTEYLLKNTDYDIYGMVRRLSVQNHKNIEHLKSNPRVHIFSGDLTDGHSLRKSIEEIKPDYYINCGAQSFVAESWNSPVNTFNTDCIAIIYILEAIREFVPECRFINLGSSEEFGDVQYSPQDEKHPLRARSPYACAKIGARQLVKVYRESYNLYALQSINFNYESKRRGMDFVTRKITNGIARIKHQLDQGLEVTPIELGNIYSKRDFSHAEDVADSIWRMLNQDIYNKSLALQLEDYKGDAYSSWDCLIKNIKEYLVSSGTTISIKDFINKAIEKAGIKPTFWDGDGLNESLIYRDENGKQSELIIINSKFYRPAEVNLLFGDSSKIRNELGWSPKFNIDLLIKEMIENDAIEVKLKS